MLRQPPAARAFRPHLVGRRGRGRAVCARSSRRRCRRGRDLRRDGAVVDARLGVPGQRRPPGRAASASKPRSPTRGWGRRPTVVNDTFALLRAGLDHPPRRRGGLRRRHQLHRPAAGRHGRRGSPRSGTSPATGAAAASCGRRRCGGPPGPRTAAGPTPRCAPRCPPHFGLASMADLIEAVHLGALPEQRCTRPAAAVRRGRGRRRRGDRGRAAPGRRGRGAGVDRPPPTRPTRRADRRRPRRRRAHRGSRAADGRDRRTALREAPKALARVVRRRRSSAPRSSGLDRIGVERAGTGTTENRILQGLEHMFERELP